ncbi:hypothetical protein [Streptococcus cristatus]|jgi:hypothetical protein|uniref:Uncharacterized protein n=1 Tax=Streptococcus cristatus TaxID=45634 RepID=A0A3R9M526_STRCR|nr:hypothetical protein [Streptococcus cristatus]RSJ88830.1 hypothetical protein D8792_07965 [Streptococcus cristatus]
MEMTDKHMNELFFEEVPVDELYGNARDFIEGFGVGIGIVAAAAGIVALT